MKSETTEAVKASAIALRVAVYGYTNAAERYAAGDVETTREAVLARRRDVHLALEELTELVVEAVREREGDDDT